MTNNRSQKRIWTTAEIKKLCDIAGKKPIDDVCSELKRSKGSVTNKVYELRRAGYTDLSLKYYDAQLEWCPNCATWRTKLFKKTGMCTICRLKERIRKTKHECEKALDALPEKTRAEYIAKSNRTGSSISLKPKMKYSQNDSVYEQALHEAQYVRALEKWESETLNRQVGAEKMRLSRIRAKSKKDGQSPL